MNDIKFIVAKNIADLRQGVGMTQMELAEKLNYSDKAISKWERGESLPDIGVLVSVADLFGVPLDYLVRQEHGDQKPCVSGQPRYNRGMITGVSIMLVWFVALFVFVLVALIGGDLKWLWLTFVYAVPASMIVWLVFNSIWFNRRRNYFIISCLMWSSLAALHISLLPWVNIWLFYLLGIPGQLIILLWSMIKKPKKE